MRILLLAPARRFIANRFGLGYQIPLGLVFLGGPLVDAGHVVKLLDNDAYGFGPARLAREVRQFAPDCILLGHTGSIAAHTVALATARALKRAFPQVRIAYGGVYPSYAYEATLRECPEIDVVVRGEAEEASVDLVRAWEEDAPLSKVPNIAFRDGDTIHATRGAPPLKELDRYRPGWELVDWPNYRLYGVGRAAGMQLSRGCPLTCTYCGQWMFWKKWRYRSPKNFVDQLTTLARDYGVKIVWLADENFSADPAVARETLVALADANLGLSLNLNMTAADVVRDEDLLPLYKRAGVDYVVMGVEALEDDVVAAVRKNNPFAISKEAVRLLRKNGMISLVNLIYGLEQETPVTLRTKFKKVRELDPDILNAAYLTPHFWTSAGRETDPLEVIQPAIEKWTYRNQVIHTPALSPARLFLGVKATEAIFHLRPSALVRLFRGGDARGRAILRSQLGVGVRVFAAEVVEFLLATRFSPKGALERLPGEPTRAPAPPRRLVPLGSRAAGHNPGAGTTDPSLTS